MHYVLSDKVVNVNNIKRRVLHRTSVYALFWKSLLVLHEYVVCVSVYA